MSMMIYAEGFAYLSVCTDAPDAATVERLANTKHPTGLSSEWKIAGESFRTGEPNPHACEHEPARRHWLLSC